MDAPVTEHAGGDTGNSGGLSWPPLLLAIVLTLLLTVYPQLLTREGHADHLAAMLLMWAMSAGFVRGTGFIPRHRLPRWLLSGLSAFLALAAGLIALLR